MAQMHFRPGVPGVLPSTWLIRPETSAKAPPVLAIHGLNREVELMADLLARQADVTGRTIILPVFDRNSWPHYQRAACKKRSDWALLALLRVLRDEGWIGAAPPDISGFSGGAQFAHRFTWLYPQHIGQLCIVAPGWWTFPDTRGSYPLGVAKERFGGNSLAFRLRTNLRRFLARKIVVMVGDLDVTQDKNLRQDPDIMSQQGPNRVQRARNWTAAIKRAARQERIRPNIRFRLMDNCGHGFADCVANGGLASAFVPVFSEKSTACPTFGQRQLEEVA
ncbi:alpha/beta hydrolase [Cognatiyoonia sp. IB215182]|uniref:alpha/beta hydrolase n=1 Tax=Cognatiyoonia sp. IB215182 TaxID=3097353 RepID=UPI002A0E2795|nr:alpha/beta hydrolase [Cognatiyoonia sp. IB215182]MDX8351073.1 alpha/beta hydrolase [Cognatiyoonia sp. IB215182]